MDPPEVLDERTVPESQIILSFGGGGFSHASEPALDDFCLRFVPPKPDLGYIGWANGDDETRISRFHARFRDLAGAVSHLPLGASAGETRSWLAGMNLVYLGGGNTARLITALTMGDTLAAFLGANEAGCVLAGVSAGGVCWFDWILSDSGGQGYRPLQGLSAISGGACPHFSSEIGRRPAFENAVAARPSQAAYAIDDAACTVAIGGQVRGYVSARRDRAAYRLTAQDGALASTRLPVFG